MSRGINKVILIGNLGADPDSRTTQQGSAVTNLNIATDESYKDKNTGQMVPKTEWHRVVMFNRLAEIANEYLKKGSKVYIEGKLQTRKWQDQSGQDRYTTEVVAHELQMLDSKQDEAQSNNGQPNQRSQQGGYQQQPQQQGGYQQQRPQQQQRHAQPSPMSQNNRNHAPNQQQNYSQQHQQHPGNGGGPQGDGFDDDIPFAPITEI